MFELSNLQVKLKEKERIGIGGIRFSSVNIHQKTCQSSNVCIECSMDGNLSRCMATAGKETERRTCAETGSVACRLCAVADPYDLAPLSGHCHETRAMLMKQLSGCLSNFHLNGPLLGISQWGIYYCIFRSVIFIGALDFLLVNIRYLRLIV